MEHAAAGIGRATAGQTAFVRPAAGALAAASEHAGGSDSLSGVPFQMPKFDWVEPTFQFLSPTFTEFLLFFATLVLFIASWKGLRRALIMTFADHAARLRTLRILNEIEGQLGGYLLTVTMINLGVGAATGIICAVTGMPNPAGLGALAATLNFFPIIGPVAMFVILAVVGVIAFNARRRADRPAGICRAYLSRGPFCHAYHYRPSARTQRPRRVHGAGVLDLAVGTDGRLPVIAAPDRGPHFQGICCRWRRRSCRAEGLNGTSREARRLCGTPSQ